MALAYSSLPFFTAWNPVMLRALRAFTTAAIHLFCVQCLFVECFLLTMFPCLFFMSWDFTRPPFVNLRLPFQTCARLPVWLFFVTRAGFLAFLAVLRTALRLATFGDLGLLAFGALGFMALRAARRVARRVARRTADFTAMLFKFWKLCKF